MGQKLCQSLNIKLRSTAKFAARPKQKFVTLGPTAKVILRQIKLKIKPMCNSYAYDMEGLCTPIEIF